MGFPDKCKGCPRLGEAVFERLSGNSDAVFIPPTPAHPSKLLLAWGEMGGAQEAAVRTPFVGPSGKKLREWLQRLRVGAGQTCFSNTVLCRMGSNEFPGYAIARECLKRHLTPEMLKLPWLACGANAGEALSGYRLPILKARGSLLPVWGKDKWFVMTLHPAFLLYGGQVEGGKGQTHLEPFLAVDAQRAMECLVPKVPKIRFTHPDEMLAAFRRERPQRVAIDIEGGSDKVSLIGFAWREDEVWVLGGSEGALAACAEVLVACKPVFHNAAYDITELAEIGLPIPKEWDDTINMAAAYNVSLPMNLQSQVLTHVDGSITWKGLVNHNHGPAWVKGEVAVYRELWSEVLRRLGRRAPSTPEEWFAFYNGLDTGWDLALAAQLLRKLSKQQRAHYYEKVMQPLQAPLLKMGKAGLPYDPARMKRHKTACQRLRRMADGIVQGVGNEMLAEEMKEWQDEVARLEKVRDAERQALGGKRVKFSRADELTKMRAGLRSIESRLQDGFCLDSPKQKAMLITQWLGLPLPKTEKGNPTTSDTALEELLQRMTRKDMWGTLAPTVKVKKRGGKISQEEAVRIVRAIVAGTKWSHWERTFLS